MKRERERDIRIYINYIYIEDDRKCVTWGRKTLKVLCYLFKILTIFFYCNDLTLTNYIIFILEREIRVRFPHHSIFPFPILGSWAHLVCISMEIQ